MARVRSALARLYARRVTNRVAGAVHYLLQAERCDGWGKSFPVLRCMSEFLDGAFDGVESAL